MKLARITVVFAVVHLFFSVGHVSACGSGGGSIRSLPTIVRHAPVQRRIVIYRRPAARPTISQALGGSGTTLPAIRLAPTQRTPAAVPTVSRTLEAAELSVEKQVLGADSTPQADGMDAFDILSGPNAGTRTDTTTPAHIGVWNARANGNATVRLSLRADDSFEWVATANGQDSRFAGRFELDGERLTLSRSSDNQKLAGTVAFSEQGFTFRLEGSKDAGLDFSRSE